MGCSWFPHPVPPYLSADMQEITDKLWRLRDANYASFQAKLIPTLSPDRIIGVRTPALRTLAKELRGTSSIPKFLQELPHTYHEENQLHAILLSMSQESLADIFSQLEAFLPYVDNWATCDSLSIKRFRLAPESVYARCLNWLERPHTYTVRFAIDVLLQFYLDEQFRPETLQRLAELRREDYYINMALAWYFSYALIKQYEFTLPLFQRQTLSPWVHNKALQKAVESRRIAPEIKAYLRTLRC